MSTTEIQRLPDGTNLTEDDLRAASARHTRDVMDHIGLLSWRDLLYAEVDAATTAIIHATEAATRGDQAQAAAALARYVLDNGHIREATDTTLGRLTVLTQPGTPRAGDLEEALNTWEAAWLEYADNYTGTPTRAHEAQATDEIRAAIAAGRRQGDILAAAQAAGTLFRADIAYFLARNAA